MNGLIKRLSDVLGHGYPSNGNGRAMRGRGNGSHAIEFIAHRNQGTLHSTREQWKDAIAAFRRAIELRPEDVKTHYNLGVAYVRADDMVGAMKEYEVLKRMGTELAETLYRTIHQLY